jgi:ATP-dependent RNA helicase DeaD
MESFQELGLPEFLGHSLQQINFSKPTPVQAQAIPAALEGKDVIASAQTGTGKTAAFGIPLLAYLEKHRDKTALILTPTRELAVQVLEVLRQLTGTHFLGGSVLLIGGANMGTQLAALGRKPRLVIGTPGRVIDHLNRGSLSLASSGFLVLDEADRMLDMGFAPQLEEIRKRLPAVRQTLLFSATLPSNIQQMGSKFLKDPLRITIGSSTQPIQKIAQMVLYTTEAKKPEELLGEIQERRGSVVVFARTQHRVDRIMNRLKDNGIHVTRIHGGRTQSQRRQALDQFREGKVLVLVATDIAARGLDIHHIAHVINYDLPRNPEDYIHRVGRTARMGAEGDALCFLTPEDRELWGRILKLMGAAPGSIAVKPSRFGFTAPKPEPVQRDGQAQGRAPKPASPAGVSHQPHRPAHAQARHQEFRGGGAFPRDRQNTRPGGGGGKNRHPEGRHQRRSDGHFQQNHPGRSAERGHFIFHGEGDRQPGQHETGDWKPRKENFIQKWTRKLTGDPKHPQRDRSFPPRGRDDFRHRPGEGAPGGRPSGHRRDGGFGGGPSRHSHDPHGRRNQGGFSGNKDARRNFSPKKQFRRDSGPGGFRSH